MRKFKQKVKRIINMVKRIKLEFESARNVYAGRVPTSELVNRIFMFCELYSGKTMYPFQEQFSKRVIRSVLENDGEEITALFSRQSGKSETIALTVGGLMMILPQLANMPMFADDPRLMMFRDGFWIGIFAPSQRQAQITYNRIRSRIQSKTAQAVMSDPEFRITFTTSNGQTVALSNGSFVTAISASDGSSIEGESFKLIICEEAQDISNFKIRKCLTGDTRVLLASGEYKSIKSIVEDGEDRLVCYDKSMSTLTSRLPYEFYDNGVQDVYELVLDNGERIKATYNHQFYTLNKKTRGKKCEFRTVEEIKKSMNNDRPLRIGVPDSLPFFAEEGELDYERGLLAGYFLGDGCLSSKSSNPKFIGTRKTCDRVFSVAKKVVADVAMNEYAFNSDNGMSEVSFSCELRDYFIQEELWGKVSVDKCLPEKLYSKSFYKGFVEALIETDGSIESCYVKPIISFANISETMVRQLKDIFLKFGVHATYFSRDNNADGSFGVGDNFDIHMLHIKSVIDLRRFYSSFELYEKQKDLRSAVHTVRGKKTRERSKYYPENMRFVAVKEVNYCGREHTYCVSIEGRNFIANNLISSNSIHPMGAAYNATIVKIGTATTFKGDFYEAIERNKKDYEAKKIRLRNHFEYDCDVASKYNPKYAKYVEKERARLGEKSDEFQMSYKLKWIIERGMFINLTQFEQNNTEPLLERVMYDKQATHVAGIDIGGKGDDTIITITEVDWDMPVIMESRTNDETGEEEVYLAYNTYVKDWLCISNEPDYEEQYPLIVDYLSKFNVVRVVCDATREASVSHRLRANLSCEVIPYVFSLKSKSELYKHLDREIVSGRARVCAGEKTVETREYQDFLAQLGDLQKGYSGVHLVVSHSGERHAHDDYPDSWALSVWGCSFRSEVDRTETRKSNRFNEKTPNEREDYRRRNRVTARRR